MTSRQRTACRSRIHNARSGYLVAPPACASQPTSMCITLTVKAERRGVDRGPRVNSLDLLSERLDLAESTNGCDERTGDRRSHHPARLVALHGGERSR